MVRKPTIILFLLLLLCSTICILYLKSVNIFEPKSFSSTYVCDLRNGIWYKTIREALESPETLDGDTISVKEGVFHEHITVLKAILLFGEDGEQNTILDGDGNGTVVSLRASATIAGFTIQNGSIGIAVNFSSNGKISDNVVKYNEKGLCLSDSNNWTISENLITNNFDSSVILNNSQGNTISGNSISYNHLPLHEALGLYNSSHNLISENSLEDNQATAIQLNDHSFYNIVSNNLLMNNMGGIQLVGFCNYNMIDHDSVIDNETAAGLASAIWIRESQYNTVYANEITSSRSFAIYKLPYEDGVGLSKSVGNNIISNRISLMDVGIGFHFYSDYNSITDNTLTKNGHGIDFSEGVSNSNSIYANNLIENAEQVYNIMSTNIWDYLNNSSGNYWSDYRTKYPNATEIDSSGKWNTPYIVDLSNTDIYPLVSPYEINGSVNPNTSGAKRKTLDHNDGTLNTTDITTIRGVILNPMIQAFQWWETNVKYVIVTAHVQRSIRGYFSKYYSGYPPADIEQLLSFLRAR